MTNRRPPLPADAPPPRRWRELPPTAGLPLRVSDLFAANADLERLAARWLGVERLRLTCSGTAAFVLALTALRSLSGRRSVVAPAYTCPLVAIAVARAGLDLKLCDLAPDSLDMDPDGLAALCDEDTLAVVPTHLAGRVANVGPAIAAARRVGAYVIEDAAQAFGARSGGAPVGTAGDIGFFSLAVGKGLTIFEGGLLWTRNETLAAACDRAAADILVEDRGAERRRAAQLAAYWALYRPLLLPLAYGRPLRRALAADDVDRAIGDVFPLDPPLHKVALWRRRVGASALGRLAAFQDDARKTALRRAESIEQISGLSVFADRAGDHGVWPVLFVAMPDEASRDAALAALWTSGLGVSRLFARALPDYGYLSSVTPAADAPNARSLAARTLTIGNSPFMTDRDFDEVVLRLRASFGT